jgi:hypothetical protein
VSKLVNQAALRRYILDRTQALRPQLGFTRVSREALERIEADTRKHVDMLIQGHPSVGKTFNP